MYGDKNSLQCCEFVIIDPITKIFSLDNLRYSFWAPYNNNIMTYIIILMLGAYKFIMLYFNENIRIEF